MKIELSNDPCQLTAAMLGFSMIAKRLFNELEILGLAQAKAVDAIKADLVNEAKNALPGGAFETGGTEIYETIFSVIDGFFDETA